MRVARSIPEAVPRVWARGIWVGEKGIVEYMVANLSGQCGEKRGGDLRIDVRTTGDLGDGSGFRGVLQGALALDVVEGGRWSHGKQLSDWEQWTGN